MRPASIVWFGRLYGLAILVNVVEGVLLVEHINAETSRTGIHVAGGPIAVLIGAIVPIALLWLVVRRASDVARWIVVVLTALSVAMLGWGLVSGGFAIDLFKGLELVHAVLAISASAMSFRPDAQAYLVKARPEA